MSDPQNGSATGRASVLLGGAGGISILASVLWTQLQGVQSAAADSTMLAKTAIEVAAQHGEEFVAVRAQLRELVTQISELKAQMSIGGRFTREDGHDLRAQLTTLQRDVTQLQRALARLPAATEGSDM